MNLVLVFLNDRMDHNISLFNFDINKDINITYPLAYLHGVVKSRGGTNLSCVNRTLSSQEPVEWPIKDRGEFKVFVYLEEGKNEVCLHLPGEKKAIIYLNYIKTSNIR